MSGDTLSLREHVINAGKADDGFQTLTPSQVDRLEAAFESVVGQFQADHFREEWQHATATLERWRFHLASLGFTQERLDRLAYLGSLGSRRPTPPEKG